MTLREDIEACERGVWQALVAGDAEADRAALAPDFLGVYRDGFAGRDEHAAQLTAGPSIASFSLAEIKVLALGPDHALIAYRAGYLRPGRGETEAMYVSSIWRRRGDSWVNVFSQDTPAENS